MENNDLVQRLEKKRKVVNSFNNHINKNKEMVTYFRDKHNKTKKKNKNCKILNTLLESEDSIVIIGATSTSITLSITGIGLNILPTSAGIARAVSLADKVLQKMFLNKFEKYEKQYEKYQQTIKYFDKFYRKSLQDNLFDKSEYEALCYFFY